MRHSIAQDKKRCPKRAVASQWDVAVLFGRVLCCLALKQRQVLNDELAGLTRVDDVVNVPEE